MLYELTSVSVDFGAVRAVDDVSLAINEGECVALVGPSGSGKTTLLKVLGAAIFPTSGSLEIEGTNPADLGDRALRKLRGRLGFIHQSLDLVPVLRVSQNVQIGRVAQQSAFGTLRALVWPRRAELDVVYEILKQVGIESKIFERTDRLSGGEQQRVAIARALYQSPRVILADEPISSVDPARGEAVVEMMTALALQNKTSCVVGLHHFDLAKSLFPRVIGLRFGKVLFDLASHEITREHEQALYRI